MSSPLGRGQGRARVPRIERVFLKANDLEQCIPSENQNFLKSALLGRCGSWDKEVGRRKELPSAHTHTHTQSLLFEVFNIYGKESEVQSIQVLNTQLDSFFYVCF